MKKYRCLICGFEFESDDANPVCPVCGVTVPDVVEIDENGEEVK